jgi:hypothetical protein
LLKFKGIRGGSNPEPFLFLKYFVMMSKRLIYHLYALGIWFAIIPHSISCCHHTSLTKEEGDYDRADSSLISSLPKIDYEELTARYNSLSPCEKIQLHDSLYTATGGVVLLSIDSDLYTISGLHSHAQGDGFGLVYYSDSTFRRDIEMWKEHFHCGK